jgi:hypothetical protein
MSVRAYDIILSMLTTLDESYDGSRRYLIFGAVLYPSYKKIHKEFREAKKLLGYIDHVSTKVREIKYGLCTNHTRYKVAKSAIDCFKNSPSFFRAIVIDRDPNSGFNLNYFGQPYEPTSIKEARAYKKFCELLLVSCLPEIQPNGLLYTDELTHCHGDEFCSLITESFGTAGQRYSEGMDKPIFKHIKEVDTSLEDYHLGQIGDILQGVILNELIPGQNRWKREIKNYIKKELEIPSLLPDYWKMLPRWYRNANHHKYQIWYWSPEKG